MTQRMTIWRLALGVGLVAWLGVAYWLYASRIYPRLHAGPEMSGMAIQEDIPYAIAFRWGDTRPLPGQAYRALYQMAAAMDSLDQIGIIEGIYFLDESSTGEERQELARQRIRQALGLLPVSGARLLAVVRQGVVTADVRTHPFEGIRLYVTDLNGWINADMDTLEICFPFSGERLLPVIMQEHVMNWKEDLRKDDRRRLVLTGLVDTTGTPEPADVAAARALHMADVMERHGWERDRIEIRTALTGADDTTRKRCVRMWIETN
jgi:outer membrane protein OmpA-like peptidoglycan-associated protein